MLISVIPEAQPLSLGHRAADTLISLQVFQGKNCSSPQMFTLLSQAACRQTTPRHTLSGPIFILPQTKRRRGGGEVTGTPQYGLFGVRCWIPPVCKQAAFVRPLSVPCCRDLTEDWPRGSHGPRHANMDRVKGEQTGFFPGVTKVVLLESCCLLLTNEGHQTNRKRNPAGEVKTMY